MLATARPWSWAGWSERREGGRGAGGGGGERGGGRHRVRLQLQPDPRRLPLDWRLRPDLAAAFYPNQQIRHLIRWESALGAPSGTMQTPFGFPRDPAVPWILHDIANRIALEPRPSPPVPRSPGGPSGGAGGPSWWEGAGRGLPLGAALLAALLLLVRLADKCFAHNLFTKFKVRRRQSEEWPTPNVMATSLTVRMTSELPTRADSPTEPGEGDPPPPYSECASPPPASLPHPTAPAISDVSDDKREEPPPPYSACYLTYWTHKEHSSDEDPSEVPERDPAVIRLFYGSRLPHPADPATRAAAAAAASPEPDPAADDSEMRERAIHTLRERLLLV